MKAFIALLMMAAITTTSCKKDKAVDCKAAAENYVKAGKAYGENPSKENCKAYKAAIDEYKNSSCLDGLSQMEKDLFNQLYDIVGSCE
ncbi:MAG: hypothetical protein ACTHMM_26295 [Agriterribacter sp.]